ncbi:MAG: bifunctional precorrin-2 dehydrogenase/sirohydrochlorin ferrochelatase [Deltaproteobacteria bacterium]|nr:bifunctional precorrin-2 dehydrogenase/sirohydrochlorin ferrochelatase [Deltaproteobacteria bacterium]
MAYYPIMVDLTGREVLVVGGGSVAGRKILTLIEYGASVSVVARELSPELKNLVESGRVKYLGGEFSLVFLKDKFLAIAATDDPELNHRISMAAQAKGMLINAVDQPTDCTFIVPSIIRRGDLVVSVSTSGKSPALAKKIREQLSSQFGPEYELFLRMMGKVRESVLSRSFDQKDNSRVFHSIVDSGLLDAIRSDNHKNAAKILSDIMEQDISTEDIKEYLKA